MLRTAPLRVLDDTDLPEVNALLERDPLSNVFVQSRVQAAGLDPWRLGAEMWGHVIDGAIVAACYSGANFVPVAAGEESVRVFAEKARRQGRRCSSIVGPADMVGPLWSRLESAWRPARDVRPRQPLMAIDQLPEVAADPAVRRVRLEELDVVLPACVAMFTEEVGVSPTLGDGGVLYRARVTELVRSGRSFARIDDGRVVFKAEVGAVTSRACQVQGVWVDPVLRGRGLGIAGMATVVRECLASVAPVVTLYVNDFNVAARQAYRRVGFSDVGMFMSVLF